MLKRKGSTIMFGLKLSTQLSMYWIDPNQSSWRENSWGDVVRWKKWYPMLECLGLVSLFMLQKKRGTSSMLKVKNVYWWLQQEEKEGEPSMPRSPKVERDLKQGGI